MKLIFENTQIAFALKKDHELERAFFLFKMIANQPLVRIGTLATNFALKAHLPVEGLIRATVFDHFVGGINEEDCIPVIDKMFKKGVCSVLDYSVEGKEEENLFDAVTERLLKILTFAKEKEAIPIAVFKPTALGRIGLFEKKGKGETFSAEEEILWQKIIKRFEKICSYYQELDISVLIDAEESWMQKAADDLILDLMRKYNTEKTIVYNTLQMYRWDRLDYLKSIHKTAENEGFKIGIKLVRGAYMEKENERAKEKGYLSPICKSKQETDTNFNNGLSYILENLDSFSIFVGTHNEKSTYKVMQVMEDNCLAVDDPRIWFGQLYGMSDHISFNLANERYNVAKYLPFGPVKDVMPYLIRRAEENTSVAGQTTRELDLIKKEKKRRKI